MNDATGIAAGPLVAALDGQADRVAGEMEAAAAPVGGMENMRGAVSALDFLDAERGVYLRVRSTVAARSRDGRIDPLAVALDLAQALEFVEGRDARTGAAQGVRTVQRLLLDMVAAGRDGDADTTNTKNL